MKAYNRKPKMTRNTELKDLLNLIEDCIEQHGKDATDKFLRGIGIDPINPKPIRYWRNDLLKFWLGM